MTRDNLRSIVANTSEAIPGMAIAVTGVSLAIYAFEANRMASFLSVPGASAANTASLFVAVLLLAGLALCYRARPSLRIHRNPFFGFLIAGLLSVSLLCASGTITAPSSQLSALALMVSSITKSLLLICWVEVLCTFSGRQCATILALAIGTTGVLNGFSALVKPDAVTVLVAMVPLLSAACLYWFKDKQESFDLSPRPLSLRDGRARKDILKAPQPYFRGRFLVFLAPLPFYTFAFGFIHYAWIPFQDGGGASMTIQMSAAAGTVLAALFLMLLIAYFWGPKKTELYSLFILFLVGIALYVSTMFQGMLPGMYVVPLNIAQKMTLFLVMMAPFLVPARRSSLSVAAVASALYTLGRGASSLAAAVSDPSIYSIGVLGAILVAAVFIIAGVMINGNVAPSGESAANAKGDARAAGAVRLRKSAIAPSESLTSPGGSLRETGTAKAARPDGAAGTTTRSVPDAERAASAPAHPTPDTISEEERTLAACDRLARSHGLTNREREILYLLAQGLNAGAIAEELTASTSTVKTHMRNVYAKLEVHTQNELLLLVHRG